MYLISTFLDLESTSKVNSICVNWEGVDTWGQGQSLQKLEAKKGLFSFYPSTFLEKMVSFNGISN